MQRRLTMLAVLSLASGASAQISDVNAYDKVSWGENFGWMNWRDSGSPAGTQGVRVGATFLSGFIWAENVGYINLGDGTPADGVAYGNAGGADFGVNLDPVSGHLSGLAWGENIGWINFAGGGSATPAQPARIAAGTPGRLRGYAWGPNVGWINLDDDVAFVGLRCPADFNGDGFVDGIDYDEFHNAFEAGDVSADFNRDGFVDGIDYDQFNNAFESGC